jgi:hypothetical protein
MDSRLICKPPRLSGTGACAHLLSCSPIMDLRQLSNSIQRFVHFRRSWRQQFAVLNDFIDFRIIDVRHALSNGTMKGVDHSRRCSSNCSVVGARSGIISPCGNQIKRRPFIGSGTLTPCCENRIHYSNMIFASFLIRAAFETLKKIALGAF